MDPFDVIQPVIDPKGGVRTKPFNHRFTRRKNHADCHAANTADPAYVLVPQQLKYSQHPSASFHSGLITTCLDPYVVGTVFHCD